MFKKPRTTTQVRHNERYKQRPLTHTQSVDLQF